MYIAKVCVGFSRLSRSYSHFVGGLNLVQRMKETLAMANGPDFIQIITWNDGPEVSQ